MSAARAYREHTFCNLYRWKRLYSSTTMSTRARRSVCQQRDASAQKPLKRRKTSSCTTKVPSVAHQKSSGSCSSHSCSAVALILPPLAEIRGIAPTTRLSARAMEGAWESTNAEKLRVLSTSKKVSWEAFQAFLSSAYISSAASLSAPTSSVVASSHL